MIVFNNQQRSGYEEITSYSPHYYKRIKEMDAVFRLSGMFVDMMARDLENLVGLQFVRNMEGEPLERLERFLKIKSDRKRSLGERRKIASSRLVKSGSSGGLKIKKIIGVFTDIPVDVSFDGGFLDIRFNISDKEKAIEAELYIADIMAEIRKKMPAHITLNYQFVYVIKKDINIYNSAISSKYVNVVIRPEKLDYHINVESFLQVASPTEIYVKLKY